MHLLLGFLIPDVGERTAYRVFSFVATYLIVMALEMAETSVALISDKESQTFVECLSRARECIKRLCKEALFSSLPSRLGLGSNLDDFMKSLLFEAFRQD